MRFSLSRWSSLCCVGLAGMLASAGAGAASIYTPGSDEDPRLRMAKYLEGDERYFSAISELMKVQRRIGEDFEASPDYWARLVDAQLRYGLRERAEKIIRNEPAATAADPVRAAETAMTKARYEYERGYLDFAVQTLRELEADLPESLIGRWTDLYSRVLLAQGRFSEAVEVLDESIDYDDREMLATSIFNRGIALINDGRVAEGRTELDRVGNFPGDSEYIRTLRDRANVVLGWNFLENQLGGSAKPVLLRVRSKGIYANRAFLGAGWAEIAPRGDRQLRASESGEDIAADPVNPLGSYSSLGAILNRGYVEDPYERARLRSFQRASISDDEEEALARAIDFWTLLLDRNPRDPAVQEAWLAVPFALDRLGAHTQAVEYYEQAIERLTTQRNAALRALKALRGGRMVETLIQEDKNPESGWRWEIRDLPDAPETYFLQSLIAEHRYTETLKIYRDAKFLLAQMLGWKGRAEKVQEAFTSDSRPSVPPEELIEKARRTWTPIALESAPKGLGFALSISAPGRYSRPAPPIESRRPELALSEIPVKFDGAFERLQNVRSRGQGLVEPLRSVAAAAAKRLRTMGSEEMVRQLKRLDRYLIEARFALARQYDGSLPDPDQDEYDVDSQGRPVKLPGLPRGEVDIDKSRPIGQQLRQGRNSEDDGEFDVK